MPYLAATVLLLGALTVLNLVMTLGIIRRLREHAGLLSAGSPARPPLMLTAGVQAGEFAATTTDGEPIDRDLLAGRTVIAFLSTDCAPCRERVPQFVELAEGVAGGRSQILAVISGTGDAADEYAARLQPVARVVTEPPNGPVCRAFGVRAFPSFAIVEERGVVAVSNVDLPQLPLPSRT